MVCNKKIQTSFKKIAITCFALCSLFVFTVQTTAASLSLSQLKETYTVGDIFTVSVYVDSNNQSVNAISGAISFSKENVSVVSISKSGSILSLWVQEPSFSNSAGTINFEGIVLNPGFTGSKGKVMTITFKTKNTGTANLSFASGSVLANDGSGSNVLESLKTSSAAIQSTSNRDAEKKIAEEPEESVVEQKTATSLTNSTIRTYITSNTHPDQDMWYANSKPEFAWTLPAGALEVRTSIGKSSNANPSVKYIPAISKKAVDPLPDGVYYFNLQIRTSEGWSPVYRHKVNIDTENPEEFAIVFPNGNTTTEPQPTVSFNTTDKTSGIVRYDLKLDTNTLIQVTPSAASKPYPIPPQEPGAHTLTVTAVDRAGNITSTSTQFTVEGIEKPTITQYPKTIEVGSLIKVRGTARPDTHVFLVVREEGEVVVEDTVRSNDLGEFTVSLSKSLDAGTYHITAYVVDDKGAKSLETEPYEMVVKSKFFTELAVLIVNYVSAILIILSALVAFVVGSVHVWRKLHRAVKNRPSKENAVFTMLRADILQRIVELKNVKRKSTFVTEEIAFLERFVGDLDRGEEMERHK